MDLTTTYKDLSVFETIYDNMVEQPIELDYLLADYCANIYKILKCIIKPVITSKRITANKVILDLSANIKILYLTENSPKICSIDQKIAYTKEVDIKDADEACHMNATAKCDYCNLRVVNPRRLDLKGVITIKLSVSCSKNIKVLDDVEDSIYQIKKENIEICNKRIFATKDFNIHEDLELTYGKPSVQTIVNYTAVPSISEYKIMDNKVTVKGNINLHLLYLSNEDTIQVLEYAIPISQIVDFYGIDENYKICGDMNVIAASFEIGNAEDDKNLSANFTMNINLMGVQNNAVEIIEDMYQTEFDLSIDCQDVKILSFLDNLDFNGIAKNTISSESVSINSIYDILYDTSFCTTKITDDKIQFNFNLLLSILLENSENNPTVFDKSIPCEITIDNTYNTDNIILSPTVSLLSVSYTLIAENQIEIRNDIKITGMTYMQKYHCPAINFNILTDKPKKYDENTAVILYYANSGENVWDIAKTHNTNINTIYNENNIDSNILKHKQMLIIPVNN